MTHVMGIEGQYPLLFLIWLAPFAGAIVIWALGPKLKSWSGPIGCAAIGVSFVATLASWADAVRSGPAGATTVVGAHQTMVTWIKGFALGLLWDPLTLVWTLIITGVGFLIHFYSMGYMHGDRGYPRFFAYMNFFVFAMLTLVLADNFVVLLVGWGLVGLASFFLIGFWFERPSAVAAATKAFVMNVVGDVGILFAIFILVAVVGSVSFADAFAGVQAHAYNGQLLFIACAALFVGCAAKSAQVPLHSWLPDAMEGPTPVSALIHAATMVTAGVYLIARCWPMWQGSADARELVGVIGGLTALLGAILGIGQWDIKRILAYSTMSQIGYMIMGVGVGAYDGGVLHFFTHAFFKAQLFLTAGIVIHALHNEQDVRRMGGLRAREPFAFWSMLVATLSICGFPPLAGFFSKDAVVYETLVKGHPVLYAIGVLTAGITAYYMFRMVFITFFGTYRGEIDPSSLGIRHPELAGTSAGLLKHPHDEAAPHEEHAPAWLMTAPVAVLFVGTIFAGFLDLGGTNSFWYGLLQPVFGATIAPVEGAAPFSELASSALVFIVVLAGIGLAYLRYGSTAALRDSVARLRNESIRMFPLLTNAFYFDAAIDALFVRPSRAFGTFFGVVVDPLVIDGAVREARVSALWLGHLFRSFQTGLVRAYALTIVFGAAAFIVYYAVVGAH
ncbi:MAG: NADH-quinone oxidoreductase subunit L [Candidatus Eremiobacteraeota bacterium]|nr:NADH-quinone oxidoreductase subunit L [Candidatus Eremiobacteraeota bacterium]